MIRIRATGDLSPIAVLVDRMARPDLMPLATKLKSIMEDGNRDGLLAGTDADGRRTAYLADSTVNDPRRPGDGPARVPQNSGSRMIRDFRADIDGQGHRISITGHWPETPFVRFHKEKDGRTGRPIRDPVGIRPRDQALMAEAVRDFASILASRSR